MNSKLTIKYSIKSAGQHVIKQLIQKFVFSCNANSNSNSGNGIVQNNDDDKSTKIIIATVFIDSFSNSLFIAHDTPMSCLPSNKNYYEKSVKRWRKKNVRSKEKISSIPFKITLFVHFTYTMFSSECAVHSLYRYPILQRF